MLSVEYHTAACVCVCVCGGSGDGRSGASGPGTSRSGSRGTLPLLPGASPTPGRRGARIAWSPRRRNARAACSGGSFGAWVCERAVHRVAMALPGLSSPSTVQARPRSAMPTSSLEARRCTPFLAGPCTGPRMTGTCIRPAICRAGKASERRSRRLRHRPRPPTEEPGPPTQEPADRSQVRARARGRDRGAVPAL